MTIYDVQNAQKTPIWKQRIIECRSSGMSVKEWYTSILLRPHPSKSGGKIIGDKFPTSVQGL